MLTFINNFATENDKKIILYKKTKKLVKIV